MDKIFEENKELKVYFKTSDGTPFYNENAAKNHAKTLEDKSVEKVERPVGKVIELGGEKPLNKMNHQELKDKATSLEIEFTNESKADLVILIEAKLKEGEANANPADNNENKED